ncbi:MAG: glycosyltransferase [Rubrivivax sp.]|nr:glycosyltransferase [Rubrivivax sp.]
MLTGPRPGPVAALAPAISLVSTLYRSRPYLQGFIDQSIAALQASGTAHWEIVLVNDGSPDDSLAYALQRRATEPRIVVVDLSRNFGHHAAMQAGLSHARGDLVFLIDCDLEVPPGLLAEFLARQLSSGADLVYGYQDARKGGWFEQASGSVFWRVLNAVSDVRIPENMLTERLMTRRFVDALLQLGDRNLFLGGMMSWTGFLQLGLPVLKSQREGRSTYTLARRVQLMVTAISAFSSKPLTWLFNIGLSITAVSFLYVLYLVFRKLVFDDALVGFTSLMGLMALSLGIMTMAVGLVGIYLGRVFNQVQNRPTFIVRDVQR